MYINVSTSSYSSHAEQPYTQNKIDQASTGKVYYGERKPTTTQTQSKGFKVCVKLTDQQQQFIIDLCNYHDNKFPPKVIFAIMEVESNFNLHEVSRTNDYGVMQINKKYFQDYLQYNHDLLKLYNISSTDYNMLDFKTNVIAGYNALIYWKSISEKKGYKELTATLASYNQGFNYFKRGYSINSYPKKVKEAMKKYE